MCGGGGGGGIRIGVHMDNLILVTTKFLFSYYSLVLVTTTHQPPD